MLMETIVCSAKNGKEKRLRKLLETRITFRKRFDSCHNAWVCQSADGIGTFSSNPFIHQKRRGKNSEKIQEKLDPKDGGIESCLLGPPLVGMFIFEGKYNKGHYCYLIMNTIGV